MTRRTYASAVPWGSDNLIGGQIPPYRNSIISMAFPKPMQDLFEDLFFVISRNLIFRDDSDGQLKQNADSYRLANLLSTWPGAWLCGALLTEAYVTDFRKGNRTLYSLLRQVWSLRKGENSHQTIAPGRYLRDVSLMLVPELPPQNDPLAQVLVLVRNAPKLKAVLARVYDIYLRRRRKMIFWCAYPGSVRFPSLPTALLYLLTG
jgi:hypothetical protein